MFLFDSRDEAVHTITPFCAPATRLPASVLNEVWGVDYYGTTRTLDQLIVKLRQKIEDVPGEPRHLLTVHTLGCRLDV
jgi:DNA-binding response OmpR family regulator